MELTQHGFLEELMALRRETWNSFPESMNEFLPNGWNFDSFDETPLLGAQNPSSLGLSGPTTGEPSFDSSLSEILYPFVDGLATGPEITLPIQEDYHPSSFVKDEEIGPHIEKSADIPVFSMGVSSGERKNSVKKLGGQPSKNLMAERRRRKRLNDRLSMLRSIVPKISKMDRTSILGDTIDYMKELLERISKLQQEEEEETEMCTDQMNRKGMLRETKPSEALVRNSPKFDVKRRGGDTRIEICCATRPGLLLSTVNTLEALGLEIQQSVISCFNDFSLQASCFEESEQKKTTLLSPEEIKQALFRTAGYGGRCLP